MQFWRMAPSHLVLFLLLSVITEVHPRSAGAPTAACTDILPLGHIAQGHSSMDVNTIPYILDLSVFDLDGGQSYVPGMTYTITLSGETSEIFRGLLVQARLAADGITPVGSFQITDSANTRLSSCTPPESAVTHPSSSIKTSVSASWTAPAEGTGGILFRYAVVEQFSTFWAPAITSVIQEAQPPPPPPTFTQPVYQTSVNETFDPTYPRPLAGFITIACIDPDTGTPPTNIVYSISTTSGMIPFAVDSASGALSVTEDLDLDTDPTMYSFSVVCNYTDFPDIGAVGTVEITILPVNEFRPTVAGSSFIFTQVNETQLTGSIIAATSGAGLTTYEVTDSDAGLDDSTITFTFTMEDTTTDFFSLNFTTGYLVLGQELDLDTGAVGSILSLRITACDLIPAVIDCPNIQITLLINEVNEFSPAFSQNSYSASVRESTPENFLVVVVQCTDADASVGAFEGINIVSSDPVILDTFDIDSTTGNITLRRQVNFEVDPQNLVFMVQCNDTEGLQSSAMVTITIEGVNEFPPQLSQPTYGIDILESTLVGVVLAVAQCTDDDIGVGAFAGIEIVSTDQGVLDTFAVGRSNGNITLEREVDFESTDRYEFMVRCFDNEGLEALSVVNVSVGDVDEAIQFNQVVYDADVNETFLPTNPRPSDGFITVTCVDPSSFTPIMNTTYNITTDTPLPFDINFETGDLSVTEDLDFESGITSYSFSVICSLDIDDGSNITMATDTAVIEITILPVNEFNPEFSQPTYSASISESAAINTVVVTAVCTDGDLGAGAFDRIEIESADQNVLDTFAIDGTSGNITVQQLLDFESTQRYDFIIQCFDNVGTQINSNVTVNVIAVNEFLPQFSKGSYEASVLETTPIDSVVIVATCTDADVSTGALDSIDIVSSDPVILNIFSIDSTTGNITLGRQVNVEVDPQTFMFTVQCNDTEGQQTSANVSITVEGVNEFPPQFSQPTYEIDAPESTLVGSELAVAQCTDEDIGVGAFSSIEIVSSDQNILSTFTIDNTTGNITLERELDFESVDSYNFRLRCFDNGGMEAFTLVNVTVENINDVLQFTESVYEAFINETFIPQYPRPLDGFITVVCVDPDPSIPVADVIYTINANVSLPFTIDNETGAISATEDLDFDTGNTFYSFVVVCALNSLPDLRYTAIVEITILPVNEFRPEIIGISSITRVVPETQMVGSVIASTTGSSLIEYAFEDPDAGIADSNVTFTFAGEDPDTSFFSLDLLTGNLTLVRGFDFDNQTADVLIDVTITLCDIFPAVVICPNLEIRLLVAAVNEFDPAFIQDVYEASIPESLAVNSEVVVAGCFDGDRGTGALARIEIINADQNIMDTFAIDSSTGDITLQQEVDFETTRSYEFTVQCSDAGFNDTAVVNITIEDVNDNSPEPQPINDIMLSDQTQIETAVTTVVCTDRDTVDSTITYTFENDLGLFEIAASSGEITTAGSLITNSTVFIQDYELTVMCADSGTAPLTATAIINIQVYKDDATPPSFTSPTLSADVRESAMVGKEVVRAQANDVDSPELQYSLANANLPGLFAINSSTGVVTIIQTLDREITSIYQTTVVATEVRVAPGTPQSATTRLTINIQDVNDNPPVCDTTVSRLTATLTAGSYDFILLSVPFSCSDADVGANRVLQYSLVGSTQPALEEGDFVINEATGQLSFQGVIRAGTYTFSVQVSDSGQPPQSITLEVRITVSSAPDETPVYVIVVPIVVIIFGLLFIIILVIVIIALLRRRRKRKGKAEISDIVAKPEDTSMVIAHRNVVAAEEAEETVIEMEERTSQQGVEAVIKQDPEEGGTDIHLKKDAPEGEKAEPEEPVKEKEGEEDQDTAPDKLNESRQPLLEEDKLKDAKAKADFESTNL